MGILISAHFIISWVPPWKGVWKVKALRRISFFVWTIAWDKILTGDNLRHRGFDFVDYCVMCMVLKTGLGQKLVLPPIPRFGQFSLVLGIFTGLDWCLVPGWTGWTGRSSPVFKTMVMCRCCGETGSFVASLWAGLLIGYGAFFLDHLGVSWVLPHTISGILFGWESTHQAFGI